MANDCADTQSSQIMIIPVPTWPAILHAPVASSPSWPSGGNLSRQLRPNRGPDAIFTRIGASDDLASGRSTFMVEMSERPHSAQGYPRSLILLDEIGRGTGTADGISIARATLEYLHETPELAAKTLFATHYHQLIALEESLPRVVNCSVQVSEKEGEVTFLHKIVLGGSDRSYGIHVAKLAGLPRDLVALAERYLEEQNCGQEEYQAASREVAAVRADPNLTALEHSALDPDELTPGPGRPWKTQGYGQRVVKFNGIRILDQETISNCRRRNRAAGFGGPGA